MAARRKPDPWWVPALTTGATPRPEQRVTHPSAGPSRLLYTRPELDGRRLVEWWSVLRPEDGGLSVRVRTAEVSPLDSTPN